MTLNYSEHYNDHTKIKSKAVRRRNCAKKLFISFFSILLSMQFSFIYGEDSQKITLQFASGEWAPFTSVVLKYNGLLSKIVTDSFSKVNIKVTYTFVPWVRGYEDTKYGLYEGSLGYIKSSERMKYFYFSESIYQSDGAFFHLKTTQFAWKNYNDLTKYNIGATIGYNYGDDFENAEKQGIIKVERIETDVQNFKKLLAGRIDIFPITIEAGISTLHLNFKKTEIEKITYNSKIYHTGSLHVIFPKNAKNSSKYLLLFNKGLQSLKKSGEYNNIIKEFRAGKYFTNLQTN